MKTTLPRRTFLSILGKGTVTTALLPYYVNAFGATATSHKTSWQLKGIAPSSEDSLILAEGLSHHVIAKWGDAITPRDSFGYNNDFLCFIPLENSATEGILWCNHEYVSSLFIHGKSATEKNKADVEKEMYNVGGSLLHIRKNENNLWELVYDSPHNRRLTGLTKIPFNWHQMIEGSSQAMGTLGNCAGGITPWGTILTCEENYHAFYGDRPSDNRQITASIQGWEHYYKNPPEHYGWIVEVNPLTGDAQKHVALGRCAHECATVKELADGRLVVYTGDDSNDEHLYKFVSSKPHSLKEGTLYVANLEKGAWLPIDINQQPLLAKKFKTQTQVLVYLREAAKIVGATPLDRPEDIEIDPVDGSVLVALTNNTPKGNYFGSILKLQEEDGKHDSLAFTASTYLAGGEETGFASPDNMVFDRAGNLWFTSDISGSKMHKPPYESFKNNGLFVVMRQGKQAGEVTQIGSAPTDAELTGPWFSPDGDTLFLSVQHPGERSPSLEQLTSHWPEGGNAIPKSSVVAIQGDLLNQIQQLG